MLAPIVAMAVVSLGQHKLVFDQDFSKIKSIDEAVWKFDDGPVYNDEKQKYTDKAAKNAWIQDGKLIIEARKDASGKITSARLTSRESWKFGTFEIVAKMPVGKGTWPAIWFLNDRLRSTDHGSQLNWPECGEIDLMEFVGYDPSGFHFSLHSGDYNWMRKEQRTKSLELKDAVPSFHTFRMDWKKDSVTMSMDGKTAYSVTDTEHTFGSWPFNDHFYMILNLAIGGTWGGKQGIDDSIFPARFEIKSVKVWQ